MKKVLFLFALLITALFTSCTTEDAGTTSDVANTDATIRTDALSIQVTFANRSTASYTAGEIVGEEDAEGVL